MRKILFFFTCSLFLSESYGQDLSPLKDGDTIHVIAPAYGDKGSLEKARENLLRFKVNPDIPNDMINPQEPLGYSNTEKYRAQHLIDVLTKGEGDIIFPLRGGRGGSALLPYLDKEVPITTRPRVFCGFSDNTALHLWAIKRGWSSLHSVVLAYNKENGTSINGSSSLDEVFGILRGEVKEVEYKLLPLNKKAKEEKGMVSSVVGGNLSVIQRSIGTSTHLQTKHKTLLIEDTGEAVTSIKEKLDHLLRADLFTGSTAIVWGNFNVDSSEQEKLIYLRTLFAEQMDLLGIPVLYSSDFGHGPVNSPLPFNTSAHLTLDPEEVLLTVRTGFKGGE